jgi:excisionase family DNA binding protein
VSKSNVPEVDKHKRLAYSVSELARLLGTHRVTIWRMISRGELKTTRVGGRHLIPTTELRRLQLLE